MYVLILVGVGVRTETVKKWKMDLNKGIPYANSS